MGRSGSRVDLVVETYSGDVIIMGVAVSPPDGHSENRGNIEPFSNFARKSKYALYNGLDYSSIYRLELGCHGVSRCSERFSAR